ncbi:MAG: DNA repair protein RecO [Sterolibacterium sp.]|nr:DNA repair protein RecO [Sterolibacterium sp.]
MSSNRQRIDGQSAYILHSYPYSETSLILDVFSREHGRLPLLARGARRPRSALRGVLLAFQPLELGWFGKGEVRTLAKAEWQGGQPLLAGTALMLGYYLNELLLRLLPRDDAHPQLFDSYVAALRQLAETAARTGPHRIENHGEVTPLLRRFEKRLLAELGYGLTLEHEVETGQPIETDGWYCYRLERGPVALDAGAQTPGLDALHGTAAMPAIRGKTLLDLARDDYADSRTLNESKQLMRLLINHHLAGQPLQSRRVFMELQEL